MDKLGFEKEPQKSISTTGAANQFVGLQTPGQPLEDNRIDL